MSIKHLEPHQYDSASAPRGGRVKGSKNKLTGESKKIVSMLMEDFRKHGQQVIDFLRVERPDVYFRVNADLAARLVLADAAKPAETPAIITVTWLAQPPAPVEGIDKVPMLELQAAEPEGDDDAPAPDAS
jgi:hypothetical protein